MANFWKGIQAFMIKKTLYSIFIFLASFFLMSHNASAIDLTTEVDMIYGDFQSNFMPLEWDASQCISGSPSENWTSRVSCTNGNLAINRLQFAIPNRAYQAGDWIVWDFTFSQENSAKSLHDTWNGMIYSGSNYLDLVSVEFDTVSVSSTRGRAYFRAHGNFSDSNLLVGGRDGYIFKIYSDGFSYFTSDKVTVFREKNPSDYTGSINDVKNSVNSINNTLKEQQEQEKQDTNQAIDDSKNTSNSSSSDVQNNSSTQSLLSVITGFFGAITSASPSSCVLTGQINEYLTPSFDMCQLSPPPALVALLSIPVAIALFLFSKHMLNKIIALIRSFQ